MSYNPEKVQRLVSIINGIFWSMLLLGGGTLLAIGYHVLFNIR